MNEFIAEKPVIWGELSPGDTHRPLIEVSQVGFLRHELTTKSTKLIDSGNGFYTIHVHSNLWYTFKVEEDEPSLRPSDAGAMVAEYKEDMGCDWSTALAACNCD